mgnify:CR=1 FL=1
MNTYDGWGAKGELQSTTQLALTGIDDYCKYVSRIILTKKYNENVKFDFEQN